ncbi:MAG: sigma-70 family RNA polymerase sigma factor [Phycisphaerae bacterium]
MSDLDERVRRAVDGDGDALTELLQTFAASVEGGLQIGKAWRSVLEPADVMQVTYLEAFLQISRFDPDRGESFEAWLRRIAQNNLNDAIRGLQRKKRPQPRDRIQAGGEGDSVVGLYEVLGVTTTTPSRHVARDEMLTHLTAALETLPEDYATAIRLYDLEGLSIDDVSGQMGRSPGAIHMLRARAHDRLRGILGATFDSLTRLP